MNLRFKFYLKVLLTILFFINLVYFLPTQSIKRHDTSTNETIKYTIINKSIQAIRQPYKYILVPDKSLCYQKENFLIAMIITKADALHDRNRIRNTWASDKFSELKNFFIVGKQAVEGLNQLIKDESETYHDILQADFLDSYRNLSIKTIVGMKYIEENCNTKFLLKIDDDIVANTPKIIDYLNSQLSKNKHMQNMFYCRSFHNAKVIRDTKNKWHLTKEEYKEDRFPTYCSGPAYILTGDLPKKLYENSKNTKLITMGDAYIGLLAVKLKPKFIDIYKFYLYEWYSNKKLIHKIFLNYKLDNVFFMSTYKQIPIWDYFSKLKKNKIT